MRRDQLEHAIPSSPFSEANSIRRSAATRRQSVPVTLMTTPATAPGLSWKLAPQRC